MTGLIAETRDSENPLPRYRAPDLSPHANEGQEPYPTLRRCLPNIDQSRTAVAPATTQEFPQSLQRLDDVHHQADREGQGEDPEQRICGAHKFWGQVLQLRDRAKAVDATLSGHYGRRPREREDYQTTVHKRLPMHRYAPDGQVAAASRRIGDMAVRCRARVSTTRAR